MLLICREKVYIEKGRGLVECLVQFLFIWIAHGESWAEQEMFVVGPSVCRFAPRIKTRPRIACISSAEKESSLLEERHRKK